MGAQVIKHINWDDLATSCWKHLFPKQSNFKKFEEKWRFILLIRRSFRGCARRQNLNVVVWDCGKILLLSLPPLDGVGFRSSCSSSLLPRSDPDEESESKSKISF